MKKSPILLLLIFCYQLFYPTFSYALTGGPSQPEVQSFEPATTTQLVDPFTGDFNYNIPLLDVDGYPINIAYHSGVKMDEEASWVGLGWNINPGVINRNMRGLPDDFKGAEDAINQRIYNKPFKSFSLGLGASMELIAIDLNKMGFQVGLDAKGSLGIDWDNYRGVGFFLSRGVSVTLMNDMRMKDKFFLGAVGEFAGELQSSSKDGLGASFTGKADFVTKLGWKGMGLIPGISSEVYANSRLGLLSAGVTGNLINISNARYAQAGFNSNFSTQSYTPRSPIQMDMNGQAFLLQVGGVLKIQAISPLLKLAYSFQSIKNTNKSVPAYGYMYSQEAGENGLYDFNREKEGQFSPLSPVLSIPVNTFDLYSASGQGIGGTYRLHRNDLGSLSEAKVEEKLKMGSSKLELGLGSELKIAAGYRHIEGTQVNKQWAEGNYLHGRLSFGTKNPSANPIYEPSYFKMLGEITPLNNGLIQTTEIDRAISPRLFESGKAIYVYGEKMSAPTANGELEEIDISNKSIRTNERVIRNTVIATKTVAERDVCAQTYIKYYLPVPGDMVKQATPLYKNRVNGFAGRNRPAHHITEVSVLGENGQRYVYGIPIYNEVEHDFTFTNANDPDNGDDGNPALDVDKGLVAYHSTHALFNDLNSTDFTGRNHKGLNHFFESTSIPAYAHSYLLTQVESPDYAEIFTHGPTNRSSGNYTKIDYYYVKNNSANTLYKWRVPVEQGKAFHNPVYKSVSSDDMATFMYGEKEIWHVRSIEGRDHIAYFFISSEHRYDACGVMGINGGIDPNSRSYRLDSIALYSKKDLKVPIKTVHFEYDHSLCKGVPNNIYKDNPSIPDDSKGKLTLKRIYFTYGTSNKGGLNTYEFEYSNMMDYHPRHIDRWGNYKPRESSQLNNSEFPYSTQNKSEADQYASAWSLTQILTPSGAKLSIAYESDDYAYVQNKKASQMYKVIGVGTSSTPDITNKLYIRPALHELFKDPKLSEFIYFQLPEGAQLSGNSIMDMLEPGKDNNVYFNFMVNINRADKGSNYEYVNGYFKVLNAGVYNGIGWIQVDKVDGHHPVSYAAWEFGKRRLPGIVYPGSDLKTAGGASNVSKAILTSMFGYIGEIRNWIRGDAKRLESDGYGQDIDQDRSWIRLHNLTGHKYGGGSRVKRIVTNDNWVEMGETGAENQEYGQEFEYTVNETFNGQERTISSGVASYEPTNGSDEISLKKPRFYTHKNALSTDDQFYSEEPYGESFFPAPVVGYSVVTVKNIVPNEWQNDPAAIERHRSGKIVYQFYTSRDYPVIVSWTNADVKEVTPTFIMGLVSMVTKKQVFGSQGFQVTTNDMHGKPSGVYYFNQANINEDDASKAYSGMTFKYFDKEFDGKSRQLANKVKVINSSNQITEEEMAVEVDMAIDPRTMRSKSGSRQVELNTSLFLMGVIPAALALLHAEKESRVTGFSSITASRLVQKYGILKQVSQIRNGVTISSENVLFDRQTGEPLLTQTRNEFKDPVYDLKYPAHWIKDYENMGGAYQNIGLETPIQYNATWGFEIASESGAIHPSALFTHGDMISMSVNGKLDQFWIYKRESEDRWYVMNRIGGVVSLTTGVPYTVKVIQSGRKNLQSTAVASLTTLASPMLVDHLTQSPEKVVSASVVEFNDKWNSLSQSVYDQEDCNYVFELFDPYEQQMKDEFKSVIIPILYNRLSATKRAFASNPHNNLPITEMEQISISETDLNATTRLKQLFNEYKSCSKASIGMMGNITVKYLTDCGSPSLYQLFKAGGYSNQKQQATFTFTFEIGPYTFSLEDFKVTKSINLGTWSTDQCSYVECGTVNYRLNASIANLNEIDFTLNPNHTNLVKVYTAKSEMLYFKNVASGNGEYTIEVNGNELSYDARKSCTVTDPVDILRYNFKNKYLVKEENISCDCKWIQAYKAGFNSDVVLYSEVSSDVLTNLSYAFSNILEGEWEKDVMVYSISEQNVEPTLQAPVRTVPSVTYDQAPYYANPCIVNTGDITINPFVTGLRGAWRQYRIWTYFAKRTGEKNASTNIRRDGVYESFVPFWQTITVNDKVFWNKSSSVNNAWKMNMEMTKYDRRGVNIESKNILAQYTSQLIDTDNLRVYAAASNARYNDIANDNMENYGAKNRLPGACPTGHFNFLDDANFMVSTDAHTGLYSMKLANGKSATTYRKFFDLGSTPVNDLNGFKLNESNSNGVFNPVDGKYTVSCWVKVPEARTAGTYDESGSVSNPTDRLRIEIAIQAAGPAGSVNTLEVFNFYPSGPIINGWQRIEGSFTLERSYAERFQVKLIGTKRILPSGPATTLFDDLRIAPYGSTMRTFVYHPINYTIVAELDENNYATYYEYNTQLQRIRTKRETEKGVYTVQEERSSLPK